MLKAHKYRKNEVTALSKHINKSKHCTDVNKVKVLENKINNIKQSILEMIRITKCKNSFI